MTILEIARYVMWCFRVAEEYNISFEEAQIRIQSICGDVAGSYPVEPSSTLGGSTKF